MFFLSWRVKAVNIQYVDISQNDNTIYGINLQFKIVDIKD